jgi:hypothetical protein
MAKPVTVMNELREGKSITVMHELRDGKPLEEIKGIDPIVRFERSVGAAAMELDLRGDDELMRDGRQHADPVMREYSLYQLMDRRGAQSLKTIEEALFEERDPQIRINLLWSLEEINSERCRDLATALLEDKDARVREWARVFCWEMGWTKQDFRHAKEARSWEGRLFDETLFLHIKSHLYVRLSPDNNLWGHVILSPQMLARVYGQALACPMIETRERELVLSKTLSGLHKDGSDHYESFLFKGFTERTSRDQGNFYFEAHAPRPFYLSGKADDASEGVVENVTVPFAREGQWFVNENLKLKGQPAIEYVRGRFQGWAYVNLDRVQREGGDFLFPGNSVLGTLHHPVVGPKTNTFLVGSFKGKVLDWDNDGVLDFNYLQAHATRQGEVDTNLDGVADVPGRSVCPGAAR